MHRLPMTMRRLAILASVATDVMLLGAVAAWQWMEHQPLSSAVSGGAWRAPLVLALLCLGCGAVALIACRRSNLVLLFLFDFLAVLAAAWLFNHVYRQAPLPLGQAFRLW